MTTNSQIRIDAFEPSVDIAGAFKSANGRFWFPLVQGKIGLPLKYYARQDGKLVERVEYVSERGLFDSNYVDSCKGAPILLSHPSGGRYQGNKDGLLVGRLDSRYKKDIDDGTLVFSAFVDDDRAISIMEGLIAKGETPQGSPCYTLRDLIGRSDGYEQIRDVTDHYAFPLFPGEGRGGKDIAMRFDSGDIPGMAISEPAIKYWRFDSMPEPDPLTEISSVELKDKKPMATVQLRLDGADYSLELDSETAAIVGKLRLRADRADALESELTELQDSFESQRADLEGVEEQADELEAERNSLKEEQVRLQAELEASQAKLQDRESSPRTDSIDMGDIQERFETLDLISPVLGERDESFSRSDCYALTPTEMRVKFLKTTKPNLNLDRADGMTDREYQIRVDAFWESFKPQSRTELNRAAQDAIARTDQQYSSVTGEFSDSREDAKGKKRKYNLGDDRDFREMRKQQEANMHTMD